MEKKKPKIDSNESQSHFKKKNRGTNDELEILTQIVTENTALLNKVLEKVYAKHPSVNPKNLPTASKVTKK